MVQVTAINTRKVHKVDGHTIFNIVKQMTGESDAEINRIIPPRMVPMIGRNDADQSRWYNSGGTQRVSWDSDGQVSWGNALKHLKTWMDRAGQYKFLAKLIADGAPAPPAWTDWHTKNKPVPWTSTAKEDFKRRSMEEALIGAAGWNQRATEKTRLAKLSRTDLEKEFYTKQLGSYHWRNKNASQRKIRLDEMVDDAEKKAIGDWYSNSWKSGNTRWNPEVLMLAGENEPQYYMSWIIANTYHSTNPDVKNISSYEGRYKYRNWELKERYYPFIGVNDTLPKTTKGWPRYDADPKLLSIFTLPEMAAALKTTFAGKKDRVAGQQQKAKGEHQNQQEQYKQSSLAPHQVKRTISDIITTGLDTWNDRRFTYQYYWYGDDRNYSSRMSAEIPKNERVQVTWHDLQKHMGMHDFNNAIKEYATNAQTKRDRIVADADAALATSMKQVKDAKAASKGTKGKKSKK